MAEVLPPPAALLVVAIRPGYEDMEHCGGVERVVEGSQISSCPSSLG
eukprot:CAMPEP_0174323768 /NCGR_PEP_ID=MMETSP0810-20121108/12040_1 /TAXON_ID=73025 ORGANISM="Eutreptiella gymnastica-like, Strain CCMP1594" /NCGR_SAMPLE_ID=MMETSP0810 /ASSEMBLY_ACC=CAM_ASM_000659 /LENGTH=46 /DNA_ID= /DNA_START= /DNA_END= /DNA_ORIENTATION=